MTLLLWLAMAAPVSGQVLVTGETGGAGAQTVVVSANLISAEGVGNLGNLWAQYGFGLTDRVDVFAVYGNITVANETQHYGGVGSNISLLRHAQHGLDLSLFSNASVPMNRRNQAATVLVALAFVASRPLTVGSTVVTPYGGLITLAPIGQRDRGLFTPVETQHAGIVGASMPLDVIGGLKAGADDYLVKPFDPEELHARVLAGARIVGLQKDLMAHVTELKAALLGLGDGARRGQ